MAGGVVPSGHDIMHLCDTKPCVRPDHLTTGTRSENVRDGFRNPANRGVCAGENNGRNRLTWNDVRAIRAAAAKGARQADLARQYGITQAHVSHIVRGLRWPEPVQAEAVA
jgi:hypothetical protein